MIPISSSYSFSFPFPSLSPLSEALLQKAVSEVKKNQLKEFDGSVSLGPSRDSEVLDRLGETCTQMTFYMASYRNNASYTLPSLLRPSELQQSRAHDPLIDGLPIAGLRDGLIEFEGEQAETEWWKTSLFVCLSLSLSPT